MNTIHKGKIYKDKEGTWLVLSDETTYQLHPDDVEQILKDSRIFDNLEARILNFPDVRFRIEKHQKFSGSIKYAKLEE
jgi:hypothetical protein